MIIDRDLSDPYIVFLTPNLLQSVFQAPSSKKQVQVKIETKKSYRTETQYEQLFNIDIMQVSRYWTMKELYEKIKKFLDLEY